MENEILQLITLHTPVSLDTPPRIALIIIHIIGVVLGVGGATASDVIFLSSIRDGQMSRTELSLLKNISILIWAGLTILILSGIGFLILAAFFTPELNTVYSRDKIIAKIIVTTIIFSNGLLLHKKLIPLFEAHVDKPLSLPSFSVYTPLIFTSGAVSATSWYTALILGAWRSFPFSLTQILLTYGSILTLAIIVANTIGIIWRKQIRTVLN